MCSIPFLLFLDEFLFQSLISSMTFASFPILSEDFTCSLLFFLVCVTLAFWQLFSGAALVLAAASVICISLCSGHAHLDKFSRHIHPNKIFLSVKFLEAFPEILSAFLRDGLRAETPERQEVGFVGLKGKDALFATADSVGHALFPCHGLYEWDRVLHVV